MIRLNGPLLKSKNKDRQIKHVIAVMSGKGGVGKSSITALIASDLAKQGYSVGVLDADITGPSIPKMFGVKERSQHVEGGFIPPVADLDIKVMSLNLLIENENEPVIWRGPIISKMVRRFWSEVKWGKLDYLIVDLPPGTGDVPITILQSLPLDGVFIVTSPQKLAGMIVTKAIKMVKRFSIPILGLIENMSFMICPDCQQRIYVFGESMVEEIARDNGISLLGKLPLDSAISQLADVGEITQYDTKMFNNITGLLDAAQGK